MQLTCSLDVCTSQWDLHVMLLHYGSSPLTLNPFQYILEFGTTHRVALCVVHLRFTKSNQTYNKSQD